MFKYFGIDTVNMSPGKRAFSGKAGMELKSGLKALHTKSEVHTGLALGYLASDILILAINESTPRLWGKTGPAEIGGREGMGSQADLEFPCESSVPPRSKLSSLAL